MNGTSHYVHALMLLAASLLVIESFRPHDKECVGTLPIL